MLYTLVCIYLILRVLQIFVDTIGMDSRFKNNKKVIELIERIAVKLESTNGQVTVKEGE